jgi:hypothetical protein
MTEKLLSKGCLWGFFLGALLSLMLQLFLHFPGARRGDGLGTAVDWRSLSLNERAVYARGYTDGYNVGAQAVCGITDQLFEIRAEVLLKNGPLSNQVQLCHSSMDTFARGGRTGITQDDYSVYSNEISDFYTKYPKYKNVAFGYLFSLLSDRNQKTADQIFQELERNHM